MGFWAYLAFILWAAKGYDKKHSQHDSDSAADKRSDNPNIIPARIQISFPPEDKEEQRTYRERHYALQKSMKRAAWFTFWAVFIYAALTLAIFYAAKKSADAAKSAADIAKDTMRLDQRAWIGVAFGQRPMVKGAPLIVPIKLTNTGKTPAINVHGAIIINLLRENEEPDFEFKNGHPGYLIDIQTIIPNLPQETGFPAVAKYAPEARVNPILVTDAVNKGIQSGKLYIAIHGEIRYEDIFGISHWIRFCGYSDKAVEIRQQSVASGCGQYNDVDKNK